MFMHMLFIFFSIFCLWCVAFCSLSLSLLQIDWAMAPKTRKSTPARNPLQGSKSSSFDPPIPLHIRFRDENAWKDFLENFQKRGVHPKHQVIPLDFAETPLLVVIRIWGWESLLKSPLRCPIVFI